MPFLRPTLGQLTDQVNQDLLSANPGSSTILRFSVFGVLGRVLGKASHLLYGYLDWISKQAVPYTATDENLAGWAALKGLTRQFATPATGSATFHGGAGALVPAGTVARRVSDQVAYVTVADVFADSMGTATVQLVAQTNGASANTPTGTALSVSGVAGILPVGQSGAITGGADQETDASLRTRMLSAFASPVQGGAARDYTTWAKEVSGVSRAWINPLGAGAGSVVLYVMLDAADIGTGGFPVGANGASSNDPRGPAATGDQLRVADYIDARRPVTSYVYVAAPIAYPVNVTLTNLTGASSATRDAITAALNALFIANADPLSGTIYPSQFAAAISGVPGVGNFGVSSPVTNIVAPIGHLPVLGTVTYA